MAKFNGEPFASTETEVTLLVLDVPIRLVILICGAHVVRSTIDGLNETVMLLAEHGMFEL